MSDPTLYLLVQARIPGVPPHSPFLLSPVTPNHSASNPTDSPARLHVSNYADPALDMTHILSQLAGDTSLYLQVDLLEYIIPFLLEGFFSNTSSLLSLLKIHDRFAFRTKVQMLPTSHHPFEQNLLLKLPGRLVVCSPVI